jgi:hypothetical protein
MSGISLTSTVRQSANQVSCDLSGDAAILDLKTGTYYSLDAVGARIWSLIGKPKTVEEIRDTLTAEYDVTSGRCESDLYALLEKLANKGLIQVSE